MSLDDLVALNDEITGLVRSGVPLEVGLAGWGRDLPGGLGRTVRTLGAAVQRGQGLPQALAEQSQHIPPVYSAIVSAGLKSGRLPAALESVAVSARNLRDIRAAVGLAILYPLIVMLVGYLAFALLLGAVLPAMLSMYEEGQPWFWVWLAGWGETLLSAVPVPGTQLVFYPWLIPPVALVVLVGYWWLQSRRAIMLSVPLSDRWLGWIPVAGRAVRHARAASLAEIMGLLVEHGVPLHEALELAVRSSGDAHMMRATDRLIASLRQGGIVNDAWRQLRGFPPLLAWLIAAGSRQQAIVAMAHHVANAYRRRLARENFWLRTALPAWLVVIMAGGVVTLYGLSMFIPYADLLQALAGYTGESMRIGAQP